MFPEAKETRGGGNERCASLEIEEEVSAQPTIADSGAPVEAAGVVVSAGVTLASAGAVLASCSRSRRSGARVLYLSSWQVPCFDRADVWL